MEPVSLAVLTTVYSVVAVVGAAIIAIIVARRRGIDKVEERADSETQKTLAAQDRRIALQDREIADLRATVSALQLQVSALTTDLHTSDAQVRRLSALQDASTSDGR